MGTEQEAGSLNCKAFPGRPDRDFIENQTKKKPCFVRDQLYFVPKEKKSGRAGDCSGAVKSKGRRQNILRKKEYSFNMVSVGQ